MLHHINACTNERAFFSIFFSPRFSTRPVMRGTRHCASRYIDPLPFQLIGGFPRGAFDDQPSATAHTATVAPSTSLSSPDRRLRHSPRTDVTDSTSVKKTNTKPISAPSTTSARCMRDHCPFPTLILVVDSNNKRPPSLYSLGLCRAHAVLLLRLPCDLVPYINQAFQFVHVKIDSSSRNVKPHYTYRRMRRENGKARSWISSFSL